MTRIVLVVAWLWVAAAAGWLSLSPSPTPVSQQHRPPRLRTSDDSAGRLCRERYLRHLPHRPGGQPQGHETRSGEESAFAGGHARVRELPRSGQAHVDDDAKGNIKRFGAMKPAEVSETCLTCHNRGTHAGWEGEHARGAEPLLHDLPQRAHAGVGAEPAGEGDRDAAVRHLPPRCRWPRPSAPSRTCRCARARCRALRATTRTARSATSRR